MTNEVEVAYLEPKRMLTPGDLVDLGNDLQAAGIIEGRALVAKLQESANQIILSGIQPILDQIRRVQDARLRQIEAEVLLMKQFMGYVDRDAVLRLIRTVINSNPRV